jgi:hypothetical protein
MWWWIAAKSKIFCSSFPGRTKENMAADNRPDFIRYYLQFPPVTRTLLTLIVLVSVSLQLRLISPYTLYASFWGSALRFFNAGWGIWFLMTLVTCNTPPLCLF